MTDAVRCESGIGNTERLRCPECGSDAVMTGDLMAMDGCWFIPRDRQRPSGGDPGFTGLPAGSAEPCSA